MEEQLFEAQWSSCKPLLLSCKLCTAVRAVDGVPGNLYLKRMEKMGRECKRVCGRGGWKKVMWRRGGIEERVKERKVL